MIFCLDCFLDRASCISYWIDQWLDPTHKPDIMGRRVEQSILAKAVPAPLD